MATGDPVLALGSLKYQLFIKLFYLTDHPT